MNDSCKANKVVVKQSCNVVSNSKVSAFSLWNQRLGHSSSFVLEHLDFIPKKVENEILPCVPCHYAKQQRLPFPNSDSYVYDIFNLIHADLWGPYKTKAITEASYFLTIVDDFSSSIWTFLLNDSSHAFKTLSSFISYTSTNSKSPSKPLEMIMDMSL